MDNYYKRELLCGYMAMWKEAPSNISKESVLLKIVFNNEWRHEKPKEF